MNLWVGTGSFLFRDTAILSSISSLAEKIQEGSYFGPIADRRGFQRALAAAFRDLADGWVEALPLLKTRKVSDLNAPYQAYRSLAGRGFYSYSDLFSHGEKEAQRFPQMFGSEELAV